MNASDQRKAIAIAFRMHTNSGPKINEKIIPRRDLKAEYEAGVIRLLHDDFGLVAVYSSNLDRKKIRVDRIWQRADIAIGSHAAFYAAMDQSHLT